MTIALRHRSRLLAAATGVATVAAFVGLGGAHGAPVTPTYFPTGAGFNSSAYTLQFSGANREGTAGTIALDAAESGSNTAGYPFQANAPNADPTTPTTLYGPKSCPTTLVLVADDTPADALSAAGLYGITALKVTDTANTAATFNTKTAALLLTQSGRENATQLDATTDATILKIKATCGGTIDGLVLGGTSAIPDSVLTEFKGLLHDAARIFGTDRSGTAAAVAKAIVASNGSGLPTVHYFPSAGTAGPATAGGTSLPSSVFLAEEQTGADALAVGAVAARLGVPILLTNTDALPQDTTDALGTLKPQNIIVLGGTGAVAATTVSSALTAAGGSAAATRVFGDTRYGTGVAIAEQLFNLYPGYVSAIGSGAYSDQLFGVARDEGSAAAGNHTGWPDALSSAYFLASLANGTTAPARTMPAVALGRTNDGEGTETLTSFAPAACGGSGSKCYPFVPLLLTPGAALDSEVSTYLQGLYPSSGSYRTASAPSAANDGGFGYLFGGQASVTQAAANAVANDLAGGTYSNTEDQAPTVTASKVFYTTQDLTHFAASTSGLTATFAGTGGSNTNAKACVLPGGSSALAATSAVNEKGGYSTTNPVDYFKASKAYPDGGSLGSCVDLTTPATKTANNTAQFYGVSLSGNATAPVNISYPTGSTLSGAMPVGPPSNVTSESGGNVFAPIPVSQSSVSEQMTFNGVPAGTVAYKGTSYSSGKANVVLNLTRATGHSGDDVISFGGSGNTLTVQDSSSNNLVVLTLTNGIVDATPAAGSAISFPSSINLFALYTTPSGATGAVTMTISPAAPVPPGAVDTMSALGFSGNA